MLQVILYGSSTKRYASLGLNKICALKVSKMSRNKPFDFLDYLEKVDQLVDPAAGALPNGQSTAANGQQSAKPFEEPGRIRSLFPETWLWSNFTAGFVEMILYLTQSYAYK